MFGQLIATLKKSPKTIVFTEGTDPRILEASARLLSGNFLKPVLVGNPEEIAAAAEDAGFNIRGAEIADPANYPEMDAMVEQMVELRKGKMTPEQCRDALKKGNYFGTMLVKMGVADCLLGGATYSTADTVRPALQLVKTKKGANLVSSCFIMVRGEEMLALGDCAINISYEDKLDKEGNVVLSAADQLAESLGLGGIALIQLTAGRAENAYPHQSSRSSNASRPRLASGLLSPCLTKIIVTKLSATNSAAYGNSTV